METIACFLHPRDVAFLFDICTIYTDRPGEQFSPLTPTSFMSTALCHAPLSDAAVCVKRYTSTLLVQTQSLLCSEMSEMGMTPD